MFLTKPIPSHKHGTNQSIIIVSGLPRSGTSMMMRMLEAGGISSLTDQVRTADTDNPHGYYELEEVKQLRNGNIIWLAEAKGKVVKIISELLKNLSPAHTYKIIFMQREMNEILASQRQMLIRRGKQQNNISDAEMAKLFDKHLKSVMAWIHEQPNIEVIYVSYNETLKNPTEQVKIINQFLGNVLDENRMVSMIDPTLYRQQFGERP